MLDKRAGTGTCGEASMRQASGQRGSVAKGESVFDIHCHILNGVDDGSRTPAESHQMLLAARDVGIDHIVCTPLQSEIRHR